MQLSEKVKKLASKNLEAVIGFRRHIHSNPELSFKEVKTAAFIAGKLKEWNIPFQSGFAGTGLVALIEGKNPGVKTVALRADMDALPIQETEGRIYGSKNPGVMHACGHDSHSASLLGVASILNALKEEFSGTVKLIFQPGEEKLPGGASLMIRDGALKNPEPVSIFGQHVTHLFPAGKVGFRSGLYMASTDELYLTVKGKGGHAALPAYYHNPLLIASRILLEINQYFMEGKKKHPAPTVVAFGKINGAGATNVIPDEVFLEGTLRTMNEDWRTACHKLIEEIAVKVATNMNGNVVLRIEKGYPFLMNDPELTARARENATTYLGPENVIDLDIWMAAEDFAYYSQVMPACFYRFGIRDESRGIVHPVHTPNFDIDEKALETSTGIMAWLAICELKEG